MAVVHGSTAAVVVGETDLTGVFRSIKTDRSREVHDATTFVPGGGPHPGKTYLAGQHEVKISLDGLYDSATGLSDERIAAALGADTVSLLVIASNEFDERALWVPDAKITMGNIETPAKDIVSVAADFQTSGPVTRYRTIVPLGERNIPTTTVEIQNLPGSLTQIAGRDNASVFELLPLMGFPGVGTVQMVYSDDNRLSYLTGGQWTNLAAGVTPISATDSAGAVTSRHWGYRALQMLNACTFWIGTKLT